MMRYIYIIIIVLFNSNVLSADTISYINIDKIFQNSLLGKSINQQINKYEKNKKNELLEIEKKIKKEEDILLSKKNIITKEEFNNNLKTLNDEVNNYNKKNNQLKKKILKLRSDNTNFILEQVQPLLTKYVKDNNISLLLNKKNLVMGKKELDITDKIIELLDNTIKKLDLNLVK